jgi:hypothetical protein
MNRLWVIGVAQAIYGLALKPDFFDEVVLVKVSEFESKSGNRSFKVSREIIEEICKILNIRFSWQELIDVEDNLQLVESNWVDIAIIFRLKMNIRNSRIKVLAYQSEYIHFMRPGISKFFKNSFRKRIDFHKKIILPCRIKEFYSLSPTGKRNLFLTEHPFPQNQFMELRSKLAQEFLKLDSYSFLKEIESFRPEKTLLLLPFASHFGGNETFNKRLLEHGLQIAKSFGARNIVIKNHPSDLQDYRQTVPKEILSEFRVISLQNEIERTFPLEILLGIKIQWHFFGVESTALLTSGSSWFSCPIVVEEVGWRSKRHRDYDLGEVENLYKSVRIFI